MVQVDRTETVVQESILVGNSVTVPAGEVWKVSVGAAHSPSDPTNNNHTIEALVNSTPFAHIEHESSGAVSISTFPVETVFTGGDVIEAQGRGTNSDSGIVVTGYEVSSVVENTPVSEQVASDTATISVPAGETWEVNASIGADFSNTDNPNNAGSLTLDGVGVVGWMFDSGIGAHENANASVVASGGSTFALSFSRISAGVHIGGFVVG